MNNSNKKSVLLKCTNPTKTITKNIVYEGRPIKKNKPLNSFNGRYTTSWIYCILKDCTSFEIIDDNGITRRISRKRFKIQ